jgi:hypothetical protein
MGAHAGPDNLGSAFERRLFSVQLSPSDFAREDAG